MTDAPKIERRGGRRPGQGRPKLGTRALNVSLDERTIADAREIGDGVLSKGIRIAVAEATEGRKNLKKNLKNP